jgi:hypothetical protein
VVGVVLLSVGRLLVPLVVAAGFVTSAAGVAVVAFPVVARGGVAISEVSAVISVTEVGFVTFRVVGMVIGGLLVALVVVRGCVMMVLLPSVGGRLVDLGVGSARVGILSVGGLGFVATFMVVVSIGVDAVGGLLVPLIVVGVDVVTFPVVIGTVMSGVVILSVGGLLVTSVVGGWMIFTVVVCGSVVGGWLIRSAVVGVEAIISIHIFIRSIEAHFPHSKRCGWNLIGIIERSITVNLTLEDRGHVNFQRLLCTEWQCAYTVFLPVAIYISSTLTLLQMNW